MRWSFFQFSHLDSEIYFKLDDSVNCEWLKHLGAPDDRHEANLRIYYVGKEPEMMM